MAGEFVEAFGQTYTDKEAAFCEALLVNNNLSWAYREAGYSPKQAYTNASRLHKQPKIKLYLEKRREEIGRNVMTLEDLLETLSKIALGPGVESVFRYEEDEEALSGEPELTPDGRLTVAGAIEQVKKKKGKGRLKFDLAKAFEDGTSDLIQSVQYDAQGNPKVTFESRINALRVLAQYYGIANLSTPEAEQILANRGFIRKKEEKSGE